MSTIVMHHKNVTSNWIKSHILLLWQTKRRHMHKEDITPPTGHQRKRYLTTGLKTQRWVKWRLNLWLTLFWRWPSATSRSPAGQSTQITKWKSHHKHVRLISSWVRLRTVLVLFHLFLCGRSFSRWPMVSGWPPFTCSALNWIIIYQIKRKQKPAKLHFHWSNTTNTHFTQNVSTWSDGLTLQEVLFNFMNIKLHQDQIKMIISSKKSSSSLILRFTSAPPEGAAPSPEWHGGMEAHYSQTKEKVLFIMRIYFSL